MSEIFLETYTARESRGSTSKAYCRRGKELTLKGSLNTRINLLYLLDSLLEVSLPLSIVDAPYPPLISENLNEIIKGVVPGGEGVLNLRAAKQVRSPSSLASFLFRFMRHPILLY